MRAASSAGIILYRRTGGELEVLLVHPGGPFWRTRDQGAWMIPKGQIEEGEEAQVAALREFEEEVGTKPQGTPVALCRIRQKAGKWVEAFALEGDLDADAIQSNHFSMEYPPRSGQLRSFPEIDRAAWMDMNEARAMILPSQLPILDALEQHLAGG